MKIFFSMKVQSYLSVILITIGFLFGLIQHKYYGYIDDNGILHDSIFLPLSALFVITGMLIAMIVLLRFIWIRIR